MRHTQLGCFAGLPSSSEHARRLAKIQRTEPQYIGAIISANKALFSAAVEGRLQDVVRLSAQSKPGELIRKYVAEAFVGACERRHSLIVAFMLDQGVVPTFGGVEEAMFRAIDGFKHTAASTSQLQADMRRFGGQSGCAETAAAGAGTAADLGRAGEGADETDDEADLRARVEASTEAEREARRDAGGSDAGARLEFVLGRLLAAGFNCNMCRTPTWDTPLHACARAGEPAGMLALLGAEGIDKGAVDHLDETPLAGVQAVVSRLRATLTEAQAALAEANVAKVLGVEAGASDQLAAPAAAAAGGVAIHPAERKLLQHPLAHASFAAATMSDGAAAERVALISRCLACERILREVGAPATWRRGSEACAAASGGSDDVAARVALAEMCKHTAGAGTSSQFAGTASGLGKSKVSGGMSCGGGSFRPPTADELAAIPEMVIGDAPAGAVPTHRPVGAGAASAQSCSVEAAASVAGSGSFQRRDIDGGLTLSTIGV